MLNILELLAGLVSFLTLLPKGKRLSWEVPPFPSSPSHQLLSRDVFRFFAGSLRMEVWGHARAPSVVPGVSWVWYRVCAYPDGDGCKSTLPVRMARRACLPIPKKSLPPHLPFLSPQKKSVEVTDLPVHCQKCLPTPVLFWLLKSAVASVTVCLPLVPDCVRHLDGKV